MAKKTKVGLKIPTENELNKRYPGMSIASKKDDSHLPWLPSRSLAFNHQLGGGIPYGKILEIFGEESSGKSVAALSFASVTTDLGGIVLWADAEQAFTNEWAEKNQINLDRIIVLRETAVEVISDWIADMSIYWRSKLTHNEPILFVCDSTAALDCMENINSKMVDSKADMGNRAKAIYKMFRIRSELLFKLGICQIYINQLRKNLSAGMFGDPDCLHYNTMVPFTNGTSMSIGDIVKNKVKGKVWSLNIESNTWEEKPIVGWVEKDPTDKWLSVETENGVKIVCTHNHRYLTKDRGWVNTKDLLGGEDYLAAWANGKLLNWSKVVCVANVANTGKRYHKYDLTIEGNHNFLAGSTDAGILVHNTTPGGKALAFYASQRIGFYGGKQIMAKIKGKELKVGRQTSIRVKKNKVAPPRTTIKGAPMYYNQAYKGYVGFDPYYFLQDVFLEKEVVTKNSSGTYSYRGKTLCRGEEAFLKKISEDDELRRRLLKKAEVNTIGTLRKKLESMEGNLYPIVGEISYESQLDNEPNEDEEDE